MDMKIVIDNIKRERYNPEHWYMLYSIVGDMALSNDENAQLYKLAGLSDDAAEFMAEWYPEYACCALDNLRYTYDFDNGMVAHGIFSCRALAGSRNISYSRAV